MKNLKITIAIITIAVIGSAAFYACKKEQYGNEEIKKNDLSLKTMELGEYENYFPDEPTAYEKLFQVMQCVNEPASNPMPNMELKEAVWFLEAFFNIGVCCHQEYAMDYVIGKEKFVITIPFVEDNGQIILNGDVLQVKYKDLLNKLVSEFCDEYAINFGDMYVAAVHHATNEVDLGITVLYGRKANVRFFVRKIADPQKFPSVPGLTSPTPNLSISFHVWELIQSPPRDRGMEALLNQDKIPFTLGLRWVDCYALLNPSIPVCSESEIDQNGLIYQFYVTTWEAYGTSYRDYIYNNLGVYYTVIPNAYPLYEPLYARCEIHYKLNQPPSQTYPFAGKAEHNFGLEYLQQLTCPLDANTPSFIYLINTILVGWEPVD
jgi:hypothetical protein